MSKLNRVVLALAIAGASATVGACGDDDGDSTTNTDAGGKTDAGGGSDAGTKTDGGKNDSGEDTTDDAEVDVPVEPECPDHPNVDTDGDFCVLFGDIASPVVSDLTLSPVEGKRWVLRGPVFVGEDVGGDETPDASAKTATLTIPAGTEILAADSTAFLLIQRGSKIEAQGTATKPIVFTTGEDPKVPGSWGGLLLNGRAPHVKGTNVTGEAGTGFYAGSDPEDSSGTVSYVRIEFGGAQLDPENEFNGLTLSGVGSKTKIDHVHLHANNDDGIEFFGGNANVKYIVATANGDDGYDWTSGFSGKAQFVIVQQWAHISSSDPRGIEADNDTTAPLSTPISNPTLSNFTLIGSTGVSVATNANGTMLRRGTYGQLHNSIIMNFKNSCVRVDGAESQAAIASDDLVFKNVRIACDTLYEDDISETLFSSANGNEVLESVDDVLEDGLSEEAPNFAPKGTSLLTGGETPDDSFFESVDFIGAIGDDDWTAEGTWVKITPFDA